MFRKYIRTWLKLKTESNGFPKNLNSIEERENWIKEFELREGVKLEYDKIKHNPGLRFISKLMLNTLWGKLGQNPNKPRTKVMNDASELYKLIKNSRIEILGELMIADTLLISYKYVDDIDAPEGKTSVAIASFVTAYARLKLLSEIRKIEEKSEGSVLYLDTDSIIFVHKPGNYKPELGNFLGQMTDEVVEEFGVGARMTEFYSCGPKSYTYKVQKPDGSIVTKIKAKGITQTVEACEKLNFNLFKQFVTAAANFNPAEPELIPQMQFRADPQHNVRTMKMKNS